MIHRKGTYYFVSHYFLIITFLLVNLLFPKLVLGNENKENIDVHRAEGKKEIDMSKIMMHHVVDAHDWHITDIPGSESGEYIPIQLSLPWILFNFTTGSLEFYKNTAELHATNRYVVAHEHAVPVSSTTPVTTISVDSAEIDHHGYVVTEDHHGNKAIYSKNAAIQVLDLSITKTVLQIALVCVLLLLVFISVAKSYTKRGISAPKGLQAIIEPVIVFVRDEIAKPNLNGKHDKYLPYLLSLFFFIWFSNLFGLTPLNSNIAGNISVTVTLAILTLILILSSTTKSFWSHIFWFPGVPLPVKLLMIPVELVGMIAKPFALTVRLFANIVAGHLMILALIGLIFILGEGGSNPRAGFVIAPLSLIFGLFIYAMEFLVAVVQAYVFTLLTAVFIGQAFEDHSHSHDHLHSHETKHH